MTAADFGGVRRGGWFRIFEPFTGAWQRNIEYTAESVMTFPAVYACIQLIASDIGKLRIRLVEQDDEGIWNETERSAFSPVLRQPNRYQTRSQFYEQWMVSKLTNGNTYVLKGRDNRGVVTSEYVLDPNRVTVLVSPDGSITYDLNTDNLSGLDDDIKVPESEIIHDRMPGLCHPLIGVSPIAACGLAAAQGLKIQEQSSNFFSAGARPGGILTAPGTVTPEEQRQYQEQWEANYGGDNAGRLAVLGGGLKYEPMNMMSAVDAQLIDQLKLSAEMVCTAFGVPAYKVGVGPAPAYNNVEALDQQYYSQTLQRHIESIEALQDKALGLTEKIDGRWLGTEFDLDDLMRMDTLTRVSAGEKAIKSGASPNEVRRRYLDLGSVKGGETPFLQEQNWPISQLAARPLPERSVTAPSEMTPPAQEEDKSKSFELMLRKAMAA